MEAVTGIFAKETGYGLAFKAGAPTQPGEGPNPPTPAGDGNGPGKPDIKPRPKLQIVK